MEILEQVAGVKALINITSDGLLNLTRVAAAVGFVIDRLIEPHPIFGLIQRLAKVDDSEMFEVFNMGIGFCYVVDPADADADAGDPQEARPRRPAHRPRRRRPREDRAHPRAQARRTAQAILERGPRGAPGG